MASLFGSAPGIIVGVGVGGAAETALEPTVEQPRQQAWKKFQNRILDPELLARLVAQGAVSLETAHTDGALEGYSSDKLDALVYLAQTVPAVAEALTMWRRLDNFDDLWTHALVKAGLDARYYPFLNKLKLSEPLDPPAIAEAIVRNIMAAPFPLPFTPPGGGGDVNTYPQSALDAAAEAAMTGESVERLFVRTALAGRPPGPEFMAHAVYKGAAKRADYDLAIAEGDIRSEYRDVIFEGARPIPSPVNYSEGELRHWLTQAERRAGAARSGMTHADSDFLTLIHGRPATAHQVFIGLARGGTYDGPTTGIDPAFLKALQESDIRPEWYNLLWHGRYTYPAAFVLRALTEAGDISQAEAEQILLFEAWEPALAKTVSERWAAKAGGTAAAAVDPHVKKAQTTLFTAMHKAAVGAAVEPTAVQQGFDALGVPAAAQQEIRNLWAIEGRL